ncbi:hypothetical protein ACA910_005011 [Epithemia clementina (nom. ined.)]
MVVDEDIRDILNNQSYSPSSASQLEEHLLAQVCGEVPYMGDSIRRLIKLYQLFPDLTQPTNVARASLLAVLEFPKTDFLALSYMIPQSVFMLEPLATVQKCSALLESCKFPEFWKTYEILLKSTDDTELAQLATRSVTKLQKSILQALALTYKEAPADLVRSAVNVDSNDAIVALKHTSVVERVDANWVTFVATVNNSKRQRVYQESVDFASISALMAKLAQ